MVRVLFYAGVREKAGTFEKRIEGFSGTLAGLVKLLEEHHGIFLLDSSQGEGYETEGYGAEGHEDNAPDLLSVLIIMINGRHIAHVGGLDAPVSDGDVVSIFPLVGGG